VCKTSLAIFRHAAADVWVMAPLNPPCDSGSPIPIEARPSFVGLIVEALLTWPSSALLLFTRFVFPIDAVTSHHNLLGLQTCAIPARNSVARTHRPGQVAGTTLADVMSSLDAAKTYAPLDLSRSVKTALLSLLDGLLTSNDTVVLDHRIVEFVNSTGGVG